MNIKVLIATTKEYEMPKDDFHMPIQVGAAGKEPIGGQQGIDGATGQQGIDGATGQHGVDSATGQQGAGNAVCYQRDDQGENISEKNPYYCELTGIYWAWKNLDADYIGLEHYRRRLDLDRFKASFAAIMTADTAESAQVSLQSLSKARASMPDIILPRRRNYYIESLYSHYAHTHYAEHLDMAAEIIEKKYPEYSAACRAVYKSTGGFMFNMFVMRRDLLDEYCTWLFDILGEMESRIDVSQYDSFQARLFGRVSEILFNVWLTKKLDDEQVNNSQKTKENNDAADADIKTAQGKNTGGLIIKTTPVIYLEKQHLFKKVINLLGSKFGNKKYEKSL